MATIQEIAEKAGVSRGTVDRALNHRGRINPQVAEKIRQIADEMGYVTRSQRKGKHPSEKIRIGVITQLAGASFMLEINRGLREARAELKQWGIELIVKESMTVNEEEQLKTIDALLEEDIHGLAIMPVDSTAISLKLNEVIETRKIPVVTFNSDIAGTKRLCFIGMDNRRSGQTAAGLFGMLTGGIGKVLVITGYFSNNVDSQRVDGFIEEIKKNYPGIEIASVHPSFDDAATVEHIIETALLGTPDINGILIVSGGQAGIGAAFEKLHLSKRPFVIIYDQTQKNEKVLQEDKADFLIDQNGYKQGYMAPYVLANLLVKNETPACEYIFTDIIIKTKYNL